MRVRFCPSPTGLPHVGLIRTVLFNWAYARHNGGKLVFRIEDTDAARDSEESYLQLLDALRWLKIDWDEGVEVGGPHAPYRQSQRHDLYREVLDKLVAAGAVYESYSTAEEIDARNEANGRAKQLGYDNFDRDLTDEQKAAFRAEGREPAWRLRVPDEDLTYVDLIRGEVTFPAGSFPDFVLVRAGGVPLYPFVNPVDDALMGITHVHPRRGPHAVDRPPARALPRARRRRRDDVHPALRAHAARARRDGNKKLSKRDPKADLFLQREKGFIHEGLLNYLSLLGWSIGPDRDVFSLDELVAAFDIVDVNPNPARFDQKKAESINGDHIRMLAPADFAARIVYTSTSRPRRRDADAADAGAARRHPPRSCRSACSCSARRPGCSASSSATTWRITRTTPSRRFPRTPGRCSSPRSPRSNSCPRPSSPPPPCRRRCPPRSSSGLGLKPRVAYGPLRVALSGRRISPPLFESMELLGKAESIRRLGGARGLRPT